MLHRYLSRRTALIRARRLRVALEAESDRTYVRTECAVFFRTRETLGELSNMCVGMPLLVAGIEFPSSEHLYQACRFPHRADLQEQLLAEPRPVQAKRGIAMLRDTQTRADWLDVRVPLMRWCLAVKLSAHPLRFGEVLRSTTPLPIVERSTRDPFWGAQIIAERQPGSPLVGRNVLGRLLTELRDAPAPPAAVPTPPVDVTLLARRLRADGTRAPAGDWFRLVPG